MALSKPALYSTLGIIALVACGGVWALSADEGAAGAQTTDDARVAADISTVAPKIAGRIGAVLVDEGTVVSAGQPLATIEDDDQRAALAAAEAELANARANAAAARGERSRQASVIAQAAASLSADRSGVALAEANADRYRALAADGSASRQEQQQTADALASARAAQMRDAAGEAAARAQTPILGAAVAGADAAVARAAANALGRRAALCIAAVDAAGHLLAFRRMDGAALVSIEVAIGKARTAACLKAPSRAFEAMIDDGHPSILSVPGLVPLRGGVPVAHAGAIVGAIGISGATGDIDEAVAEAAAAAFVPQENGHA